jgi:ribosomal subunit interface protein
VRRWRRSRRQDSVEKTRLPSTRLGAGQCERPRCGQASRSLFSSYEVIIQGKQLKVSGGLKRYAEEHVVQPLRRFYDNDAAELRVELGKINGNRGEANECHLTLYMPGAKAIQIEESLPDVYGCLDVAGDRLARSARKALDRMRQPKGHHKYRPLGTVAAEGGVPAGMIEDLPNGRLLAKVSRRKKRK